MNKTPRPIKRLGQNFLVDSRIQQKIVNSCALKPTDIVVEIGPGKGAITHRILPMVQKLIAIEKDRELVKLFTLSGGDNQGSLEIVHADFLKWDMSSLPLGLIVVGNIPYYISTPIIEKILEHRDKIQRAYLTVQLEFGQRLAAQVGTKDYGSLSCFVQYYADVKVLFKISRGCFHPQPKVESCFVSLIMKPIPGYVGGSGHTLFLQAKNEQHLFVMIQNAFMQRRKTILNALGKMIGKADFLLLLQKLKINPQSRPEDLTLLNYIEISNNLVI